MNEPKPKNNMKIYKGWVCEKCGDEFNNSDDYNKHRANHPAIVKELDEPVETPPPAPIKESFVVPPEQRIPVVREEIVHTPPKLRYQYDGVCPNCGRPVETIPLVDIPSKDKVTMVAWCSTDKRNIVQRIVDKL